MRPGAPGETENIRVRSIIGRFLEHSRVFHFAGGKEDPLEGEFFIGSADWMVRNLSKRVEVVTPIFGAEHRKKLYEFLHVCLRDERQAWVLGSDGSYTQLKGDEGSGTHQVMMGWMRARV